MASLSIAAQSLNQSPSRAVANLAAAAAQNRRKNAQSVSIPKEAAPAALEVDMSHSPLLLPEISGIGLKRDSLQLNLNSEIQAGRMSKA